MEEEEGGDGEEKPKRKGKGKGKGRGKGKTRGTGKGKGKGDSKAEKKTRKVKAKASPKRKNKRKGAAATEAMPAPEADDMEMSAPHTPPAAMDDEVPPSQPENPADIGESKPGSSKPKTSMPAKPAKKSQAKQPKEGGEKKAKVENAKGDEVCEKSFDRRNRPTRSDIAQRRWDGIRSAFDSVRPHIDKNVSSHEDTHTWHKPVGNLLEKYKAYHLSLTQNRMVQRTLCLVGALFWDKQQCVVFCQVLIWNFWLLFESFKTLWLFLEL